MLNSTANNTSSTDPPPSASVHYPRPVIFDFPQIPNYFASMLRWLKAVDSSFSIRKQTRKLSRCSPSLVTQVIRGKRKLTLEKVDAFARIFRLTAVEKSYLFSWINMESPRSEESPSITRSGKRTRSEQNHILSDWLNPYVKDSARLKGFQPDPKVIHRILGGMASVKRIQRSLQFLLREGFLRKTLDGRIVENDVLVVTSDELPNKKLRVFHRRALDVAKRSLDVYPMEMRQASTLVLPMNESTRQELKQIMKEFYQRLLDFAEEHESDSEQLYQVVLNLTPIGGVANEN